MIAPLALSAATISLGPGVEHIPTSTTRQPVWHRAAAAAWAKAAPDGRVSRARTTVAPGVKVVPKAAAKRATTSSVSDWPTRPRIPEILTMSGALDITLFLSQSFSTTRVARRCTSSWRAALPPLTETSNRPALPIKASGAPSSTSSYVRQSSVSTWSPRRMRSAEPHGAMSAAAMLLTKLPKPSMWTMWPSMRPADLQGADSAKRTGSATGGPTAARSKPRQR